MAQIIPMPKLSDTMKEGVLRKWHKKEGDKIGAGDLMAEIETDKATMDFESFDSGTLLKRLVPDGSTVPINAPIAIFGTPGEDISALLAQADTQKGEGAKAPVPAPPPKAAPAPAPAAPKPAPAPAAPAPRAAPASPAATPAPAASNGASKILASPLARRLASELGVDLRLVQGSGPGGRVVERDVKAAAEAGSAAFGSAPAPLAEQPRSVTMPLAPPPPAGPPESAIPRAGADLPHPILPDRRQEARPSAGTPSEDTVVPLSLMRKTIARRLVESKTQIPHFYLTAEADMEAAMKFREQVKEVHGAKLSVNDMVIKAVALALRRNPECNATYTDAGIVRYARVDIGMAVAVEDGLLTPVIRSADVKTLGQIAAESQDLAKRARDRKLKPEDMTNSTFSISNLGMMGIKEFSAIINPPEAGILAVGAVRKEPVVRSEQIVVGQRMSLTISCDHRVIDGALGAKLLSTIISILERPITLAF
jgi:pyruvate dehydrogenase E2 component (dihydrolipoamide acetyltransferase)